MATFKVIRIRKNTLEEVPSKTRTFGNGTVPTYKIDEDTEIVFLPVSKDNTHGVLYLQENADGIDIHTMKDSVKELQYILRNVKPITKSVSLFDARSFFYSRDLGNSCCVEEPSNKYSNLPFSVRKLMVPPDMTSTVIKSQEINHYKVAYEIMRQIYEGYSPQVPNEIMENRKLMEYLGHYDVRFDMHHNISYIDIQKQNTVGMSVWPTLLTRSSDRHPIGVVASKFSLPYNVSFSWYSRKRPKVAEGYSTTFIVKDFDKVHLTAIVPIADMLVDNDLYKDRTEDEFVVISLYSSFKIENGRLRREVTDMHVSKSGKLEETRTIDNEDEKLLFDGSDLLNSTIVLAENYSKCIEKLESTMFKSAFKGNEMDSIKFFEKYSPVIVYGAYILSLLNSVSKIPKA